MEEIWKELPIKGYHASNLGSIRKGATVENGVLMSKGGELSGKLMRGRNDKKNKHLRVDMPIENGNKKFHTAYIHKLVAEAFVPKPSELHIYVVHIDNNVLNNAAENLQWLTESERCRRMSNPKKAWEKRREVYGQNGRRGTKERRKKVPI